MKTKLEMAHEIAVAMQSQEPITDMKILSALAWEYADAMQAEADKREKKEQSEHVFEAVDEWKPDWSQAPDWAKYFTIDSLGIARFWDYEPTKTSASWFIDDDVVWRCEETTIFNYKGDWRNSLRKRPQ